MKITNLMMSKALLTWEWLGQQPRAPGREPVSAAVVANIAVGKAVVCDSVVLGMIWACVSNDDTEVAHLKSSDLSISLSVLDEDYDYEKMENGQSWCFDFFQWKVWWKNWNESNCDQIVIK